MPTSRHQLELPALPGWAFGVLGQEEGAGWRPATPRRLGGAELLPKGRLVEIADSYALIPLDQPAQLASMIREFVGEPCV